MSVHKNEFGKNFHWGVSTSAFQTEGAPRLDGKGDSIWDVFASRKRKIAGGHSAHYACKFYEYYDEDLRLMRDMNIKNFRFSISWSRILPTGTGKVNQKGIDFYNKLINRCLEYGIEPWVTIYHWDLPHELELKGGWTNRDIEQWFIEFVKICAKNFGDRVNYWMVLNEPMVFTGAGYFLGVHAPGKIGLKNFLAAAHHATVCQAQGGRVLKLLCPNAKIGTTFSCSQIEPFTDSHQDKQAAIRYDALLNRLFLEPSLGLGYPTKELKFLERIHANFKPGDEAIMPFQFDFIGLQNYTRELVSHSYLIPYLQAKIIRANKRKVPSTLMNWEIHPPSLSSMLQKFDAYPNIKEIIVTENGAAFEDKLDGEKIHDIHRTSYLQSYIQEMLKAKKNGVKVGGYFVWSFMDNFEWAEGYYPRFGIVHVDFDTQKRRIKHSGLWYKDFLK